MTSPSFSDDLDEVVHEFIPLLLGVGRSLAFLTASFIGLASLPSLTSSLALFATSFCDLAKFVLLRVPLVIVELCLFTFSMSLPSGVSSSSRPAKAGAGNDAKHEQCRRAQGENKPFAIHRCESPCGGKRSSIFGWAMRKPWQAGAGREARPHHSKDSPPGPADQEQRCRPFRRPHARHPSASPGQVRSAIIGSFRLSARCKPKLKRARCRTSAAHR